MRKDAKIYVAGHGGLVGSAIVKNLQSKGYADIVTRTRGEMDLTDQRAVADFFADEKPEYVFLAAAKVGGIAANNTYRAEFIYENLQIQNNIIHQSYVHGVKKLLFLGSTCIYPKNAPQPMPEECLLTDTLEYTNEPYAIAKIAGIKMCEAYNLQYGTDFISVMPTNLYGPNDNFDLEKSHVLPAIIRKVYLGRCLETGDWDAVRTDLDRLPVEGVDGSASESAMLSMLGKYGITYRDAHRISVEIWGSGKPMREFLWSEDMADACVFLMENRDFDDIVSRTIQTASAALGEQKSCEAVTEIPTSSVPEIRNTHINIGTGVDISIRDLAEMVKAIIGFQGTLHFNTDKPDGTMRKLTDVGKLHALGWHHRIDLEEGITMIYEWYRGENR